MNKIKAVALNLHDHNTYDGVWHNQRERHTRFKHNLPYYAEAYAHQSDKLNPNDYRLNDEFIEEYAISESSFNQILALLDDESSLWNLVLTKDEMTRMEAPPV